MNELEVQKHLVDKAVSFLEKIVNPPLKELGGLLSDKVKFWRFKNQINIIIKAEDFLKQKGIQPKKIPLKTLVPLLEYSSWEEDPNIQTKWASLLANAVNTEFSYDINSSYVEILNQLSPLEVKILDFIHHEYMCSGRPSKDVFVFSFGKGFKDLMCKIFNIPSEEKMNILIDDLRRLNLIRLPLSYVNSYVNMSQYYDSLQLTPLGYDFIKHCKFQ